MGLPVFTQAIEQAKQQAETGVQKQQNQNKAQLPPPKVEKVETKEAVAP